MAIANTFLKAEICYGSTWIEKSNRTFVSQNGYLNQSKKKEITLDVKCKLLMYLYCTYFEQIYS